MPGEQETLRRQIARVIDPLAFEAITQDQAKVIGGEWLEGGELVRASRSGRRAKALAKADAIIALLPQPGFSDEQVEAAARAFCLRMFDEDWDQLSAKDQADYRAALRSALTALTAASEPLSGDGGGL